MFKSRDQTGFKGDPFPETKEKLQNLYYTQSIKYWH